MMAPYNPSKALRVPLLATIGSSTIARGEANISTGYQRTWGGVVNAANIIAQGRFYCPQEYSRAVSGENTNDMAGHQLAEVLALNPRPKGCYFQPGSNDIRSAIPFATSKANIVSVISALLNAGITPIIGVPQPTIGDTATIQAQYVQMARYLRDLSASTPGAILVDPTPAFIDAKLTTYETLSIYTDTVTPRIHLNHYGTQIYAQALVQAVINAGWQASNDAPLRSNGDLYSTTNNLRGSLMANGMMSGTGGSITAPATGTLAAGWLLTPNSVGGTVAVSQDNGQGCVITMSGTAVPGTGVILYRDLSAGELANISAGDKLELVCEASWGSLVNIISVGAQLRVTQSGVTTDDLDGTQMSQSGPLNTVSSAVFRPPPRTLTAAPTAIRARLWVYPESAAAMSATINFKSCVIRKVIQ